MQRRAFLYQSAATLATATRPTTDGERFAKAARGQLGVTTGYDPRYVRIAYPGGEWATFNSGLKIHLIR